MYVVVAILDVLLFRFSDEREKRNTHSTNHKKNIPIAINSNTRLNDVSCENNTKLTIIQHFFNQTNEMNTFEDCERKMEWVNTS